ncbi:MAG TPA: hypothetical protein VF268_03280 [Gammaproteobacteria bacterium]
MNNQVLENPASNVVDIAFHIHKDQARDCLNRYMKQETFRQGIQRIVNNYQEKPVPVYQRGIY